jgi:thiamine pyrophosphate-dependent acetolactate synthase large subunit-like protein
MSEEELDRDEHRCKEETHAQHDARFGVKFSAQELPGASPQRRRRPRMAMNSKRRLTGSFWHGSMANAMAQSISAQAAFPGRQVISLSGDGGFTMLMGDFLSLAQLGLPVKVVVFNNSALGFIEIEQKSSGFLDFGTSFKNPNFAAMAEASGVRGIRIENSADVDNGIATALAHIPVRAELERHYDPRQDSVRPTLSADQHRK